MGKQFLVAVDVEGVHGVVGEAYKSLHTGEPDYDKAVENAVKETNAVVKGLFDGGAELVAVWDNHWKGTNMDFSQLDSRVIRVENPPMPKYERLSFAKNFSFDGILFVGYHARAGSVNGVLAHSYNSVGIQYYKVNGAQVGELEIDSWAAAEYGIPPLFCSSDDVCVGQALAVEPRMNTVITKIGKGRNSAVFRDENEVLAEMREKAEDCVRLKIAPEKLAFPSELEVRFTRSEDALKRLDKVRRYGISADFGEDAHTVVAALKKFADLESFL